jgi:hypothetical protein
MRSVPFTFSGLEKDAADYIMRLPKAKQNLEGMADSDRGPDPRRDARRADDARQDRRDAGAAPERRVGIQSRSERHALGQAEAEA